MPKQVVPVKHRLTLTQLSTYDDILTDALVDHVYFWTTIRKNKNLYHPSRGITEEDVTKILQKHVIVDQEPAKAESAMLALSGIKKFHDGLKTDAEKKDFREHLRRYVNIYCTDCPWEVSTTNRYTVVTQEAAVTARRDIKRGETIKYLCGVQVVLTDQDEENIKVSKRDFSVVVSSRSKTSSLFLGPARFANHDCDANARLKATGNSGMEIVAYVPIYEGEEITVSYGDNYFGDDNCECLCRTCEKRAQNGWTRPDGNQPEGVTQESIEEGSNTEIDTYQLRRRRRESASRSPSVGPDVVRRPQISKRTPRAHRFQAARSPLAKSFSAEPEARSELSPTPSNRKRELDSLQMTPSKRRATTKLREEITMEDSHEQGAISDSSNDTTIQSNRASPAPSSIDHHTLTDVTSVDDDEETIIGTIAAPDVHQREITTLDQAEAGETILVDSTTSIEHPAVVEIHPTNVSITGEGNILATGESKKPKGRKKSLVVVSDKDHAPSVRYPGDYILTAALLSEPEMSWISCKGCKEYFIQKDAYFTRSACPRCERHSKLYGYSWPKTDPEDSEDDEERVLDHRTVHRFVDPAEEKLSRKLARQSSGIGSQILITDVSETVVSAAEKFATVRGTRGNQKEKGNEKPKVTKSKSAQNSPVAKSAGRKTPFMKTSVNKSSVKKPSATFKEELTPKRGVGRPRKHVSNMDDVLSDTVVVAAGRRLSGRRS